MAHVIVDDVYSAPAVRAAATTFFNVAEEWKLSPAQQIHLLALPSATCTEVQSMWTIADSALGQGR